MNERSSINYVEFVGCGNAYCSRSRSCGWVWALLLSVTNRHRLFYVTLAKNRHSLFLRICLICNDFQLYYANLIVWFQVQKRKVGFRKLVNHNNFFKTKKKFLQGALCPWLPLLTAQIREQNWEQLEERRRDVNIGSIK